ncbi:hypothetical protein SGRIM128S_03338 [Streptomyces griseomycini]
MRSTWPPGVGSDSGIPSYRSTTRGSGYPRCPSTCSRPAREPRTTSPWLPTAGAISSATSCTTSCTPTASVSAPARLSTWEMVTRRVGVSPDRGAVRFISATARARLMRTLSPVVLGYSRKDSHSPGGRSATKEVTCWLNSAARYRSSYTGSFSHGTDAHSWAPSSRVTGTPSSSAAAALAKPTRPCTSSEHRPYGSRDTIRAASTVPSVPAMPPPAARPPGPVRTAGADSARRPAPAVPPAGRRRRSDDRVPSRTVHRLGHPHDFGADERALLTAAAGLAGQALMRARAFDAEHELVGMLQRKLLPRRLPRLPGAVAVARYLPSTAGLELGGDWYDVIPLPDNHVALVIGDVQGHSAGAATLMGQMRTALRLNAVEGHPPDVVVSHANRLLVDMETDLFATCCYVDIDMEEGFAWCVRAGHLPPVVRHPDGSTEIAETEGGPPLGVMTQADFPMSPLRLQPGTLVALTTDGLVESAEADIDEGMDRLARHLSAADPAHLGLVADALLGNAPRSDDVALLLVRYDGMATRPLRESWTVWRVPQAVGHARRFTRRTLRSWGVTEDLDTALLVVSELVTNALVHTDGQVRLDIALVNDRLRLAVADASPRTPVKPTSIGWEATGGRGILLVEAVSAAWGTLPVSGGKQVWAEFVLQR